MSLACCAAPRPSTVSSASQPACDHALNRHAPPALWPRAPLQGDVRNVWFIVRALHYCQSLH
eukprot:11335399-Alexandrium_andersonii.AAC.1